ncbi:hypothetical protein A0H81_00096 [Grifola frondosa]|uniref:Uncharacterized protein n=1 Tax=Grifola frondosa TaxID=5627 RepID=A0A1C7MRW5_GRIFR|nr:hypothetical protein A0H81_00096 [Grifola frondosa]
MRRTQSSHGAALELSGSEFVLSSTPPSDVIWCCQKHIDGALREVDSGVNVTCMYRDVADSVFSLTGTVDPGHDALVVDTKGGDVRPRTTRVDSDSDRLRRDSLGECITIHSSAHGSDVKHVFRAISGTMCKSDLHRPTKVPHVQPPVACAKLPYWEALYVCSVCIP